MLKNCSSQKGNRKDKIKRNKVSGDSESKEKKEKRGHLRENTSSKESRSKRVESIRQKQTELGSICVRKGIGEKDKQVNDYFFYHHKGAKTKKNNRNKSQSINKFVTNTNETNPTWNYISYMQNAECKGDSSRKDPSKQKVRITSSRGSMGFIQGGIRQSRAETNMKNLINPESVRLISKKKSGKKSHNDRHHNKSNRIQKSKSKELSGRKGEKKHVSREKKRKKDKKPDKRNKNQEVKKTPSPKKQLKMQSINFKLLHDQIEEEEENIKDFKLNIQTIRERARCINMLGKICSSMNLKRQTHFIAIAYLDKFLDATIQLQSIKTIMIAALMMALKVDHAENIGSLVCQFSNVNSFQAVSTSTEPKSQQKTIKKIERMQEKSEDESPHLKFNLNRPKQPNIFTTVLSCEQIFSEYDHILCKQEIADMEMQIMVKLNFKLSVKSIVYWVDTLTLIWDAYIRENYSHLKRKLLYQTANNIMNFSCLNQLVEASFFCVHTYEYSRVLVILSFMYIITRVSLQFGEYREEKGFQTYKVNLSKSSNAIFVDKYGANELFGKFLSLLNMQMGDIVNCCQYVSMFLNYKMLKVYTIDHCKQAPADPLVNGYQYNPELYRFVITKIYQ